MIRTIAAMGTFVTIQTVGDAGAEDEAVERVERAFEWFRQVETRCTRFDPASESRRLAAQVGVAVPASDILFEAVQFAVAVAEASGGAFDPAIGGAQEARGFNRNYRNGRIAESGCDPAMRPSYRDIRVDPARKTITLCKPLVLDLGAVAKGLAIDLAARELRPLVDFAIDAGGDLYLAGRGPASRPWTVGIRHPREDGSFFDAVTVSDAAVCTSGDYERRTPDGRGHHLLDPRSGTCADAAASATVIAPTAMVADALATAAFVLGPIEGLRLLEREGVEGLMVSAALEQHATRGFGTTVGGAAVLRNAEGSAHHRAADSGGTRSDQRRRQAGRARTA